MILETKEEKLLEIAKLANNFEYGIFWNKGKDDKSGDFYRSIYGNLEVITIHRCGCIAESKDVNIGFVCSKDHKRYDSFMPIKELKSV